MGWMPKRDGLVGWLLAGALMLSALAPTVRTLAQPPVVPTTQLTDTIYRADGTAAGGTVLVSWPAFTTSNGLAVAEGNTSVTLGTGGQLSVTLAPNAGSSPMGSYYTAIYHLDDGTVSREYWVVPVSQYPVTVGSIKSTVLPASVALQTVTKSYVDTAITAAVTGHPLTASSPYVLVTGDTMTGALVLPGDPTSANQAADKNYVDVSVSAIGAGIGQKVAENPVASQVVAQPTGTDLSVNLLNGQVHASQYASGAGSNGISNAVASADCASGCNVAIDRSYASGERMQYSQMASETHLADGRLGAMWESYLNPENMNRPGVESGHTVDVVSTRNGTTLKQLSGTDSPASIAVQISHEGLAGGQNQFPQSIEGTVPYFKSAYSALTITGTYNAQGEHVLTPQTLSCYGVGDCLAGAEEVVSSGGFRDEADEGTHPMDIQFHEDSVVFDGTCSIGCTQGSTALTVAPTTGVGTAGEGRFLLDMNPLKTLKGGALVGGGLSLPHATAIFTGTSFPVSTFFATGEAILSQANNLAPGAVTLAIATSGVATGYATNTAAAPAPTGVACVVDQPNADSPANYEMADYTVVDGTHLQMTFNKVHNVNATIAIGGLCGYGLEQTADTTAGIRQVFPVVGSYSATGLYYASTAPTSTVAQSLGTSAYLNLSLGIASLARSGNVVTVTTTSAMPKDLNGLSLTIAGAVDSSYNGTFAVTTTGRQTLTYTQAGANSTSSGGTLSLLTGGYVLYPMAEALGVMNPATKVVDGTMTLAPNTVAWAAGDAVEQPHFYQQKLSADTTFVGQTMPRAASYQSAGVEYDGNNGPGLRGWQIDNATPMTNYFGNGGTHAAPDFAFGAFGVWEQTMNLEAGEESVFTVGCNSHGCGSWDSPYNLFELESTAGTDVVQWTPTTSALTFELRGTTYSFSPSSLSAPTVNATTVNATTLTGALSGSSITSGTVAGARLGIFGASGPNHGTGAVPDPGATAGATRYLREDGNWTAPTGGAGTETPAQVVTSLAYSYGLEGYGDSKQCSEGAGATTVGNVVRQAQQNGEFWLLQPTFGGDFTTYCEVGDTSVDMSRWQFTHLFNMGPGSPNYVLEIGTNDARTANAATAGYQSSFTYVIQGEQLFAAIPRASKVYAQDPAVTTTGTWTPETGYQYLWGQASTVTGSTISLPVTVGGDGNLVLWSESFDGGTGTYTVQVDGGALLADPVTGSTTFASTGYGGVALISPNGTYNSTPWFGYVFSGYTAGAHTVKVTVTSAAGKVEIGGAAGLPSAASEAGNPYVFVSGVEYQQSGVNSNPSDALTAAYNAIVQANVARLAGYGLNVEFEDTRNALLNSPLCGNGVEATMFANCYIQDGVHPNLVGHSVIAALYTATATAINPALTAGALKDPRKGPSNVYHFETTATDPTHWWSMNGANAGASAAGYPSTVQGVKIASSVAGEDVIGYGMFQGSAFPVSATLTGRSEYAWLQCNTFTCGSDIRSYTPLMATSNQAGGIVCFFPAALTGSYTDCNNAAVEFAGGYGVYLNTFFNGGVAFANSGNTAYRTILTRNPSPTGDPSATTNYWPAINGNLPAVNGTPVAGHLATFYDASGDLADGGAVQVSETATAAAGTGVSSVAAATATLTNLRGTLTIAGGTATAGTIATLSWAATPTAYACTATQNGGAADYLIGNSVATATGFSITAGASVAGATVTVNYSCQQ